VLKLKLTRPALPLVTSTDSGPSRSCCGLHTITGKSGDIFAHPSTLNDPMEVFTDIFWHGDQIVWETFFAIFYFVLTQRGYCLQIVVKIVV
jgi:hypothetical protein